MDKHTRTIALERSDDLMRKLAERYPTDRGWVVVPEVTLGNRRVDAIAVNTWPSRRLIFAFEIKCARSDWLRELSDPSKREAAERHSNAYWFVAPSTAVIKKDEVPSGWGLLTERGDKLVATKQARQNSRKPDGRGLLCALLTALTREHAKEVATCRSPFAVVHGEHKRTFTAEEMQAEIDRRVAAKVRREHQALLEARKSFERYTRNAASIAEEARCERGLWERTWKDLQRERDELKKARKVAATDELESSLRVAADALRGLMDALDVPESVE